jgi:Family of unknown function (DUF6178)
MPGSVRRRRRKGANALRRTRRLDDRPRRSPSQLASHVREEGRLLDRILETPHVAYAVPRLQPEVLHRIIQTCGLEDCGELVALATPAQLQRVFDLDLWRAPRPGRDEHLDVDRFAVWLEVLMEPGARIAGQKIVAMEIDLVIAALAQHVRVFDRAALSSLESSDQIMDHRGLSQGLSCEIGSYLVEARRNDAWDTIIALLLFLDAERPDDFHRVMRGCRRLSNAGREVDGLHNLLDDRAQHMFEVAIDREGRREKQGYVTPAQARAFLKAARQLPLDHAVGPPANPIAAAYFRGLECTPSIDPHANYGCARLVGASASPDDPAEAARAIAAILDVLQEAGVLTQQPRALLEAPEGDASVCAQVRTQMQFVCDRDDTTFSTRMQEFAYLANALLAGCSVQARPFTEREASDATLAICNLGLENWPCQWLPEKCRSPASVEQHVALPEDFLVDHDLISVFQVGCAVLHDDVCMYAAARLISVLADLKCDDRETQTGVDALRTALAHHWRAGAPWRARAALDVLAILDLPAWAALLALIDECPVIHAGMMASRDSRTHAVSASAFTFISENNQIASVRQFMESLPETLRR